MSKKKKNSKGKIIIDIMAIARIVYDIMRLIKH